MNDDLVDITQLRSGACNLVAADLDVARHPAAHRTPEEGARLCEDAKLVWSEVMGDRLRRESDEADEAATAARSEAATRTSRFL
jgi:hypothetical protein